jgi:transposase
MPRKKRQFSVEKKLKILEEARQPGTTVAEVLRRHQVDPTTFYRWEQQAKDAIRDALSRDRRRTESADKDHEIEQLRAELTKKSRIIAEVVEENLDLKKNSESRHEGALQRGGEVGGARHRAAGGGTDGLVRASDPETAGDRTGRVLRMA